MSEAYSRVLVAISLLLAFGLLSFAVYQICSLAILHPFAAFMTVVVFAFPTAFGILFLLLRLAPLLVAPPLVLRKADTTSILNLGAKQHLNGS